MAAVAAVLPKSCSMDSRRVAETADEDFGVHGGTGAKADAVARDASRAMEVFMLLLLSVWLCAAAILRTMILWAKEQIG